MRLFLCGGGSGKQIDIALHKFSSFIDHNKPVLYIPLAMEKEKYDSCFEWFSSEMKRVGIYHFDMVTSSKELSSKNFYDYSALFIGGGNTFKLLKELKEYSNFDKIQDYLNHNGILFGGSAGAIIFGKSINSCLLDDGNLVQLEDCSGFNYLKNYSILCHFNSKNLKKNFDYLLEFSKEYKTIYLPEEDVILVNDHTITFIGEKKYMIFDGGHYFIHNFANIKKDLK